ncbi:PD-(D/E)XK nuclease family protein [Cyanobium sp. FGCU-52]|nr:PD-(D/E)XK nuclease family protein [Cyanobium sp. FGCU52]
MPEIQLPDYPYTPQLGWSTTRSETFRTCRRRYFFQYYARFVANVPQDRLQRLRRLSSIPMTVPCPWRSFP